MVFVVRVRPVENVRGTSYTDVDVYAAVPSVPPAPHVRVPALLIPEPPFVDGSNPVTFVVKSILPTSIALVIDEGVIVVALPILVIGPVRFALVVTVDALPEIEPVALPMLGVVKTGEVERTNEPVPVSSESRVASCDDVVDAN